MTDGALCPPGWPSAALTRRTRDPHFHEGALMNVPHLLDHIVIAGPDLQELVDWLHELTRITAAPGRAHPTGTSDALVALTVGGRPRRPYLDLIGPDPERRGEDAP